ncbi:hypothetical protein [Campylobacter geochelonis]|uniref:Lipoprotein n=1 Tax=Campylobacter geochelonis TaxID=1780362 RepID=A0A128ENF3_9BACT|nr:hypothetical protein [Campylobacter geochelonis]QKF70682.1 hypothetical protein CGEO_0349 [Campylobacter geochelonis]CZE45793.1 Uncharacterised protein [Campylobacter geochelonis]CZE46848.1 Uncharacterised protein [Campylobacter geochelonis]CZE50273.1 Uncharacterised protein [Campylobacter geochelonis]
MSKIYLFAVAVAVLFAGCSASNWNLGKTPIQGSQTDKTQPTMQQTQQNSSQNFHINTVINTWGEPDLTRTNSAGNQVYVWQNCKATGKYIERCDQNTCETIPEQECCERALITDQNGYVQNLKEAVNSCM